MRYGRTYPAKPIIKGLTLVILLSPRAPTSFAATASDGSTTISLSWVNNASPLTNTRVEVSNDGVSGWAEIANSPVASPGTSTTHAVGSNSATRYYRARAYDSSSGLYSGYTSVVSATTASPAPSALTVTAVSNSTNLQIAWTDNSSDETSFGLERSNDGVSGWSEITAPAANATSYTDTSVGARDTRRYYRIRAKRSGDSINSSYSSTANAYTAPADPSGLTLTPGSTTVTVAWTDNSSTETEFRIERKTGSGGAYAEIGTDTASPYSDSTTAENTEYYYKVRAYRTSDGIYSGYCSELNVTTGPTAPSNLQGGCTVSAAGASKVRLFWESNTVLENGFKLQRSTDNVTFSDLATTAMGIQNYEDTGLAINTTYYYRVAAISLSSGSSYSDYTTSIAVTTTVGKVGDLFLAFQKKVRHFPSS